MKKNIGLTDKIIRVSAAIFVAILYFIGTISGTIAIVLGIFALIMIFTSFVSFCPLYLPFGINTRKKSVK
jgi:hypothetical protein